MLIHTPQIQLRALQEFYIRFPTCALESLLLPNFPYIKKTHTSETYLAVMFAVCWVDAFIIFIVQFWLVHEWLILFNMESHAVGKWKIYVSGHPFPGIATSLFFSLQLRRSCIHIKTEKSTGLVDTILFSCLNRRVNKTKKSNLSFNSD